MLVARSLGEKLGEFLDSVESLLKRVSQPSRGEIARLTLLAVIGIALLGGLGMLIHFFISAIVGV